MQKENDRLQSFTRRAVIIGGLQGTLLALLGGRLAWLQIAEGSRYRMLSDQNQISMRILAPSRGQIVDRYGVPLAINNQNFRAMVIPEQTDDIEKSLLALRNVIQVDDAAIRKVLKLVAKSPKYAPLEIKEKLNWDEVSSIEVNLPSLPGLMIDEGEIRNYPFGEATAHLIGYVGAVSQQEMTEEPLLKLPDFQIGKSGAEKTYDAALRGRAGRAEVEVNVVGREVRELKHTPSVPG